MGAIVIVHRGAKMVAIRAAEATLERNSCASVTQKSESAALVWPLI